MDKTDGTNDYEQTYVEKDKDGKVTLSSSSSQTTDPTTKAVTEKSSASDANGSTESEKVTQANGDYVSTETKKDANGAVTETTAASKTTSGTDYEEKSETKDGNGTVIESFENSKKTDAATGETTEVSAKANRDGSAESTEIKKDATGNVNSLVTSETKAGVTTGATYEGTADGLKLDSLTTADKDVVIDTVSGIAAGETYPVTEIGEEAFAGNELDSVTLGESVTSVNKKAFADCGMTELNINGTVTKKMFAKNSLKGNGTKKKGKGLTINVASKKDKKAMKKQAKKAGVPKAKIVVGPVI